MGRRSLRRYEIRSKPVGEGKQGRVYFGRDAERRKGVAVKETFDPAHAEQEARAMRSVGPSPYLPAFVDCFLAHGRGYLVTAWISGRPLRDVRAKRKRRVAVGIALDVLKALQDVHAAGYLHGDVHVNNVMFAKRNAGRVKLIDLGRALPKGEDGIYRGKHERKAPRAFAPPEQRRSGRWTLDDSSDLYKAAGLCVYLMTRKKPALDPASGGHRCTLKNKKLQSVLNKAMRADPKERYRSAAEFIRALEPFA